MPDFSDILLTVDYDRTLTGPDGTVPQRNMEAIEYFIAHGGAFTVNTGRSIPMARAFIGKVPVSAPLLLYNGSAAYDAERGVFTRSHPIEMDGKELISQLRQLFPKLTVEVQGVDAHYIFEKNEDWEVFSQNGGCTWGYADVEHIPDPFLKCSLYGDCSGRTMGSMYEITPEESAYIHNAMDTVRKLYGDKLEVFYACPRIVDIHAKGVSKARSARDLQKDLGRKILICVGDGHNDVSMLDAADYAYCPRDGIVAARYENVCECGKGAVADVIFEKIPEILKNKA